MRGGQLPFVSTQYIFQSEKRDARATPKFRGYLSWFRKQGTLPGMMSFETVSTSMLPVGGGGSQWI